MRIFGTLGPSCEAEDRLIAMFREGMTGIRVNLSHVSLHAVGDKLLKVQRAAKAARMGGDGADTADVCKGGNGADTADVCKGGNGASIADACAGQLFPEILIDLQGPELRIGELDHPMKLSEGETILLGAKGIPVPEIVLSALVVGDSILLDDGKLEGVVTDVGLGIAKAEDSDGKATGRDAKLRVVRGGLLESRKSLAILGKELDTPALTAQDYENLSLAKELGVTGLMQPFVRGAKDLQALREAMNQCNCADLKVYAKLENRRGLEHLDEIVEEADEIVIARGDLGNAIPLWELPHVQRRIAAACCKAGKPFMVVTQMLASMEHSPVPTRAEISDIDHAIMDGADSIMVTGETAVGEYPVEVIRYMAKTARVSCEDRRLIEEE